MTRRPVPRPLRHLVVICGDQLGRDSAALDGFDPDRDAILMTEAAQEATHVESHKKRLVLFFAAMRHFADDMRAAGRAVLYHALDDPGAPHTLAQGLGDAIRDHAPDRIRLMRPGDWRVLEALRGAAAAMRVPLDLVEDDHFLTTPEDFASFAAGRKRVILEDWQRALRRRTGWLMEGSKPAGGRWNFDAQNRRSFGRDGPGLLPRRAAFDPDKTTRAVMAMVEARFAEAPGSTAGFAEPVTPRQADAALGDFIQHRLPLFGDWQDAMAAGQRTLYHSRLSAALNLHLLTPRAVCEAALRAHADGCAPINAVEGFVRQILGWREFVRGVYWARMPDYAGLNALEAQAPLPTCYWTGETEMACLRDALGNVLDNAYGHHIERLMITGLFLMLYGADPAEAQDWHEGMYLDAVNWVSLPNMLGMSQHADGGIVGTKPYCASGAYINRMSDYCAGCRFNPKQATGPDACPFTTLYWDFLDRHERRFAGNRRMAMQLRNLDRKTGPERAAIRRAAGGIRERLSS